ncbi:hypothetical protein D9M73_297720 [compost metagenome]
MSWLLSVAAAGWTSPVCVVAVWAIAALPDVNANADALSNNAKLFINLPILTHTRSPARWGLDAPVFDPNQHSFSTE